MNSNKQNIEKILLGLILILGFVLFYLHFVKKDTFKGDCKCTPDNIIIRTNECEAGDEDENDGCGKLIENDSYVCISEGVASPCK